MTRRLRRMRMITGQHVAVALAALALVAFVAAILAAKAHGDAKTEAQIDTNAVVLKQLDALRQQLDRSEIQRKGLTADRERWQAQITTSIDQLREAGQQPIIVAPDAVKQPDKPIPTTTTTFTMPPIYIPAPTTTEPTTTEPTTTEPTTEPTTTEPTTTEPTTTEPTTTEPTTTEPTTTEPTTTTTELLPPEITTTEVSP